MHELPIIDIAPLVKGRNRQEVAKAIRAACIDKGFFYIVGHGVSRELEDKLETLSHEFFLQPNALKEEISMTRGGRAWRGFFPLGAELTSGKPDWKEGLYFGEEHRPDHPLVLSQTPLHGANQFPPLAGFRETILSYIDAMTQLGHQLMTGIALSLGLPEDYFQSHLTKDPTLLFRVFHYPPPLSPAPAPVWGVGEHTDYGLLTILKQDDVGGLEVKSKTAWIEAPPIPHSFVCNIGDMLDRLTKGLYRSTPHRVQNKTKKERYSFPFFFDPGFEAKIEALPIDSKLFTNEDLAGGTERWDKANIHTFDGTYGDYLMAKVGKVFPDLKETNLKST